MSIVHAIGWLLFFVALGGILQASTAIGLDLLELFKAWRVRR